MRTLMKRAAIVAAAHLILFEVLSQFGAHWPESVSERAMASLCLLTFGALVWAALPAFAVYPKLPARIVLRAIGVTVLSIGLFAVDNVYAWHVRPSIGLYREDAWVAKHPGFQRELRARVEVNRWGLPGQR